MAASIVGVTVALVKPIPQPSTPKKKPRPKPGLDVGTSWPSA